MKGLCIFILLFCSFKALGQNEVNNWYFGYKAGLSFTSGTPTALLDGQLITGEGCATISDKNGNLLFYTNGVEIWNRQHQVMVNGAGLLGEKSSSQSAVIVPQPGNDSIFYVFTTNVNATGLYYSIVNIRGQGGIGEVVQKNVFLLADAREKLNAVRHCNNKDVWVLTRQFNSDAYYAYLVTASGILATPVVSHIGNFIGGSYKNAIGLMKCSPDGRKLAVAHNSENDYIEVLDFNNQTGQLSNPLKLSVRPPTAYWDDGGCYGVEFSGNSQMLYVSSYYDLQSRCFIHQFDLTKLTEPAIQSSKALIDSQYRRHYGAMQLGPDGKIYVAELEYNYLSVINQPNNPGTLSDFLIRNVNLGAIQDHFNFLGLPTFIQSYFRSGGMHDFSTSGNCTSNDVDFRILDTSGIDSVKWDFGEPSSGASNFSTLLAPQHSYLGNGVYKARLVVFQGSCFIDTLVKDVWVGSVKPYLGRDTVICQGSKLTLSVVGLPSGGAYNWNTGDKESKIEVTDAGQYWTTVTLGGCQYADTIAIQVQSLPVFSLGADKTVCEGASVNLAPNTFVNGSSFLWNTTAASTSISVGNAGNYWLRATTSLGCSYSDTVNVQVQNLPVFSLGKDTVLCEHSTLTWDLTTLNADKYFWSTGASTSALTIQNEGFYWAEIIKNNCSFKDSILVNFKSNPIVELGKDTILCEGQSLGLDAQNKGAIYLWQDNSTSQLYMVNKAGTYYVKANDKGCYGSDTIKVDYNIKPSFSLGLDQVICEGQYITLKPVGELDSADRYLWSDGSTQSHTTIKNPGVYCLKVSNRCGSNTDEVIINQGICNLYVPTAFTPNSDGKNDVFKASFGVNITSFKLEVFNRWGQQLFVATELAKGWDGKFKGVLQPEGVYPWVIRYRNKEGEQLLKGTVILIR